MKICIFIRFPLVQSSHWKKSLIDKLIDSGHDVKIIFGESSIINHMFFFLKKWNRNKAKNNYSKIRKSVKLYRYYKNKIEVHKVNDLNSSNCHKKLKKMDLDLLLLLGSGIISEKILKIPKKGTIHSHQGDLPKMRGVNTIQWSLLFNKKIYISVHFVDSGIDTGNIILKKQISCEPNDTIEAIYEKCDIQSINALSEAVEIIGNNDVQVKEQSLSDGRQYFFIHPFFYELAESKIKSGKYL